MKLDAAINDWCKKIIELSSIKRKDETKKIVKSGYDIKSSTKRLEKKYIELLDNSRVSKNN